MHGKFGLLSLLSLILTMQCFRVSTPPAVMPTLFTMDGYGIFNMRTNLSVCRTHKGGSGTNKSAQELTLEGQQKKTVPHPAPPGDRTQGLQIRILTVYH